MPPTLEEQLLELEQSNNFKDIQLYHWLSQLQEYKKRDTPMAIQQRTLSGKCVCPGCGGLMALGVEDGYCNLCGQALE